MFMDKVRDLRKLVLPAFLLIGLAAFLVSDSQAVSAQEPAGRMISVTGQAEIYVKPDVATISFGVETNGATAQEAQQLNAAAMNKVIAALQGQGIAKKTSRHPISACILCMKPSRCRQAVR